MIYLLHYDRPLHHAQHYLGSCDDPQRIQDHGNGTSRARLPQVFCQLGVEFVVARTWEGGRTGERKLKNQKNARVLCPICRTAKLTNRAKQKRDRRAQRKLPFPDSAWIHGSQICATMQNGSKIDSHQTILFGRHGWPIRSHLELFYVLLRNDSPVQVHNLPTKITNALCTVVGALAEVTSYMITPVYEIGDRTQDLDSISTFEHGCCQN